MSISTNTIEHNLIDKFNVKADVHPLFRSEEDYKNKEYNKEPIPVGAVATNEQRRLQGESLFGGGLVPLEPTTGR